MEINGTTVLGTERRLDETGTDNRRRNEEETRRLWSDYHTLCDRKAHLTLGIRCGKHVFDIPLLGSGAEAAGNS